MISFKDKVVFITGASGGIGGQMARDFGAAGATVVAHNHGLPDATAALLKDLEAAGVPHLLVEGDVTDTAAVEQMATHIAQKFGRLDVLVNNAGASGAKADFSTQALDVWNQTVALNLTSVYLVIQACLPLLEKSSDASIINLSSTAARNGGVVTGSAYAAAKGGVSTLTKALAKDFCAKGIRVNAVAPGLIDTPFYGNVNVNERYAERITRIPLHRVGRPSDISGPVMFLASSLAAYMTGEVIEVSGGLSIMA
ncbi:SDR family NAD(P)-dependent oxidoreductase [Bordetella sp. BOR01]|uniref:SDR family NAD(P)-dependent oxidoreductase n=1 Tax=Bordetella sp. BOR01 TaxID=2854779 RepID=UPI001C491AB3|nr:SDR family NAD(P)-dependent oxidoreductase [Bordetella sp. BOR01]MBV7486539.1 SDR family oxidoreductase [Bordetella sp. BOR01]